MQYYSGDSHIVEHWDCFTGLTDRYGDRAPQIIKDYKGRPGDWYVLAERGVAVRLPEWALPVTGWMIRKPRR